MATFLQPGMRRHHAVRFVLTPALDLAYLTRLDFSRRIVQTVLGMSPAELNCLVKLPGSREIFEVSFKDANCLQKFWKTYEEKKGEDPMCRFVVEPLSDREVKVVTVNFYNEAVCDVDIETWLRRHCIVASGVRRVRDPDGVWTAARRWLVKLHADPQGIGGVRHLPSVVMLGYARGEVMYNGMPKLCRNCGGLGHLAAACPEVRCRNCGADHETRVCTLDISCNLCGKRGHVFRDCPQLYANVMRRGSRPHPQQDVEQEEVVVHTDSEGSGGEEEVEDMGVCHSEVVEGGAGMDAVEQGGKRKTQAQSLDSKVCKKMAVAVLSTAAAGLALPVLGGDSEEGPPPPSLSAGAPLPAGVPDPAGEGVSDDWSLPAGQPVPAAASQDEGLSSVFSLPPLSPCAGTPPARSQGGGGMSAPGSVDSVSSAPLFFGGDGQCLDAGSDLQGSGLVVPELVSSPVPSRRVFPEQRQCLEGECFLDTEQVGLLVAATGIRQLDSGQEQVSASGAVADLEVPGARRPKKKSSRARNGSFTSETL